MGIVEYLERSADVVRAMASTAAARQVEPAARLIAQALKADKPLLVCGNGGSASDSQHIAGELVGRFLKERRALRCISLSANTAVLTALGNDYSYDTVFARQVEAYGEAGGVLLGISTSGNSANVLAAFAKAKALGMTTIALTGQGGGKMAAQADILIDVPSRHTPEIQQVHICLYHFLCERIETLCLG